MIKIVFKGIILDNISTCKRVHVDVDLINSAKKDLVIVDERLKDDAGLLSLLGNEVRLKILYILLKYKRMCVCDLSDVLGMKQSPISQHLRKMKDAKLLTNKREGMTIFYSISKDKEDRIGKIIKQEV